MNPPPDLSVLILWIGFALVAAAGVAAVAATLIAVWRMIGLVRNGAPDAAFDQAGNRGGRVLGLAVPPLILGVVLYVLGAWLALP